MLYLISIALLSLLISLMLGRFLYKSNLPPSLIDNPNSRKVHTTPTPLIGGITIIFTMLIIIILFEIYNGPNVQQYIIFSLYFFFVGLFDDLFQWKYQKKFVLQLLGIVAFIISISQNITILNFSSLSSSNLIINYILIGFWILFILNAFNFFDGINVLAGGLAVVFFTSYSIYFAKLDNMAILAILLINIFSIIGFLIYNRAPAKMFLGDAGSMFIGFNIASFPFIFTRQEQPIDLTFFVLLVFILISDTIFVVITRLIKSKSPFQPDKTHLHHQLLNLDFRNRYVVLIILLGSIIHSFLAFKSNKLPLGWIILILVLINTIFILFPRFLPYIFKRYNLWDLKQFYDKSINYLKHK